MPAAQHGRLELAAVRRRDPVLRPSPAAPGVFGVDPTAGFAHRCVFCPVAYSTLGAAEGVLPFDPFTADSVRAALLERPNEIKTIVLGPLSDPLPPIRAVRAETVRVAQAVLESGVSLLILTRGRFPRRLIELLAAHRQQSRVAVALLTLDRALGRALEGASASPLGRVRDLRRLASAGVPVEVRLEPLLPGLTDTRENLMPLFRRLRDAGANRVVAHYLFLHPSARERIAAALAPWEWDQQIDEIFEDGPRLNVGSMGKVQNLPLEIRQEGLARVMAWGADYGLNVTTGAAQNPDLPRSAPRPIQQAMMAGASRDA